MTMIHRQKTLAIDGGEPVRTTLLPYGRQQILEEDIAAVVDVLRCDWLTTGPKVPQFEETFAAYVGAKYAVSFSSGTSALHGAAYAAGLRKDDEAITAPLTFCATANCIAYQQAVPVFADILSETLTIDPVRIEERITNKTKAIFPVDYAGHPAAMSEIMDLAKKFGLIVIEDACHSPGAEYKSRKIGAIADMTAFSFHPVKHITTGEGGMITTNDADLAAHLRVFRNHGINSDARARSANGQWYYEMLELGYNYRLTDIGSALGLSQLSRIESNLARRREIAARYNEALNNMPGIRLQMTQPGVIPSWHLYTIRCNPGIIKATRNQIFTALRGEGIGVNVHYIPVHLHPYYRSTYGYRRGDYPASEEAYDELISLPIFHGMTDQDANDVIIAVRKVLEHYSDNCDAK